MIKNEELNKGRQLEFDVAKALAVFFMVIIHVSDIMGDHSVGSDSAYNLFLQFIGAPMAAPMFMFAMGVGMVYTRHDSSADFARRGLKLIIMGYALNFFRETLLIIISNMLSLETDYKKPLIDTIGTIDILQFAGMTFLIVSLMKKLRTNKWMLLGVAILLQAIGTVCIGLFDSAPKIVQYLFGLLFYTNQYISFPTALWLVYPVLGICFASILRRVADKQTFYKTLLMISVVCLVGISVGTITLGYDIKRFFVSVYYYQQNFFSTLWITCILGISISAYYFISKIVQGRTQNIVKYISSNLNTIYIIQWLLITYSVAIKEMVGLGGLPAGLTIPVGIVVVLCSIGITWLWNRLKARRISL